MIDLTIGQIIAIPCQVFPGAFNHEAMVIIDTLEGEVSGFVRRNQLTRVEDNWGFIKARIVDDSENIITVVLRGSFFTTTGLAVFSPEWTKSNAEAVYAE